jgi:glyoxylase-like metal-dependent hydrolase (beta-lactamase superfamily II)
MTDFSRRTLLAGAAVAGAASTLAPIAPARAAAPPVGKQAPGFYRHKVGSFEVTAINDGARTFPLPDTFVRNKTKAEVNTGLESVYMAKDSMTIPFTPQVINTGAKLVLIDTGNGPQAQPNAPVGMLSANMTAAGIDPKTIDTVIISHFHGDHINGLRNADGSLIYPNAEVMVPEAEWAFWMDDAKMNAAPDAMKGAFQNVRKMFGAFGDKVTKYGFGKELVPGISSVDATGHTPGHTAFTIASGNGRMLVQSDVTNIPLFVKNPGWHLVFDMDGGKAEATRRKLFDMAVTEKMLVAGYHFPFPGAGYIEKDGEGYRLVPMNWSPTI